MSSTPRKRFKRREPFGKAGLTVAICALVFALVGGAYAAGGLTKSQEKQVTKIAKKYAGKPGAAGEKGAPGANGTNGTNGKDGAAGTDGKSVTEAAATAGECNGVPGGVKYTLATTTKICNGKEGPEGEPGEQGSPWTAGGTLPVGATETGVWFIPKNGTSFGSTPVSFNIPLAAPLNGEGCFENPATRTKPCQVHALRESEWSASSEELCEGKTGAELTECEEAEEALKAACPGTMQAPTAKSGNLCLYEFQDNKNNVHTTNFIIWELGSNFFAGPQGTSTAGAMVVAGVEPETEEAQGRGTWAVTG